MTPAEFERFLSSWHDFFLATSGGAAALLGLLFVAVSLNLDDIAHVERVDLRVLAEQAFSSFLFTLLVALFLLVPPPYQTPTNLAIEVTLVAMLGLIRIIRRASRAVRHGELAWGPAYVLRRLGGPAAANLSLLVAAAQLLGGDPSAFIWLFAAILTLLLSAADSSWDLLVRVGAERGATRGASSVRGRPFCAGLITRIEVE